MSLIKRYAEKMGWFDDNGYHSYGNWEADYLEYNAQKYNNPSYKEDGEDVPESIDCMACSEDMSKETHDDEFKVCQYCRDWNMRESGKTIQDIINWLKKT